MKIDTTSVTGEFQKSRWWRCFSLRLSDRSCFVQKWPWSVLWNGRTQHTKHNFWFCFNLPDVSGRQYLRPLDDEIEKKTFAQANYYFPVSLEQSNAKMRFSRLSSISVVSKCLLHCTRLLLVVLKVLKLKLRLGCPPKKKPIAITLLD